MRSANFVLLCATVGLAAAAAILLCSPSAEPEPPTAGIDATTATATTGPCTDTTAPATRFEVAIAGGRDGAEVPSDGTSSVTASPAPPALPTGGVSDYVKALQSALAADAPEVVLEPLRRGLARLLGDDERHIASLLGWLDAPDPADALVAELLAAVAIAGTEPAERFLVTAACGPHRDATRIAALHALRGATALDADSAQLLVQLLDDPAAPRAVQTTCLLLLGDLAHGGGTGAGLARELQAREAVACQQGLGVEWLEAMARSGQPAAIAVALRLAAAPDPRERAAAAAALQRSDDPRASDALLALVTADPAASVRATALGGIAGRPGSMALAALANAACQDADAAVRRCAAAALAARPEQDEVRRVLAHVAAQDADAPVRELAASLLAES
jgi:hypothetical protein